MGQIFHPSMNTFSKVSIFGAVFFVAGLVGLGLAIVRSPYMTGVDVVREQPVPFSHEHHVNGLGIDCRYCHTTVETSSFAGIPPTHTCMTCHSQIWNTSPMLQPVRDSYKNNVPIQWNRVHNLADYVYFNHSIHVNKGIGCSTCHGEVDKMPLMRKANTLQMEWCIGCHKQPEQYLRPQDQIYNMQWQPPANQLEIGSQLVKQNNINKDLLLNCSTCHH